jgi:CTP-dependent riboflavin kinase
MKIEKIIKLNETFENLNASILLAYLAENSNDGKIDVVQTYLSQKLRLHEKTVERYLRDADRAGYITRRRKINTLSNLYKDDLDKFGNDNDVEDYKSFCTQITINEKLQRLLR